jgi:4-amino-4-deoxy-L-arabinose transferase-like glycosyltransferase
MTLSDFVGQFATRRRAPVIAALVALLASLPGLFTLPATDRDESRFAEASAQMLESGDFTNIMFQDTPRYKKPVGIYWLQAASVAALSDPEARAIWAYRIPSVLGAMLAAAACAWGALAFLPPAAATASGALLAATTALSSEANLATTDAALCGAVTLSMAAMARLYLAHRDGPAADRWTWLLFWLGLAGAVLLKGPIGPMVAALTAIALVAWDRRAGWLGALRWDWGLIVFLGVVLPWTLAISVETDGGFWGVAVGGDLAPKLFGGQEGHGAPPGYFLLLSPILLFPAALLAPAAAVAAWRGRTEPAVRFALCWLVPSWLIFELVPTKLPHYTLPTFGAICWLMAATLTRPLGTVARRLGALANLAVGAGFAVAGALAASFFGGAASWVWASFAAILFVAAAIGGALMLLRGRPAAAAAIAGVLGVAAHGVLVGALAPTLNGLWLSKRIAADLARATPSGFEKGPPAVAGYAEPSLVFALGAPTELGTPEDAADAINEGRPAIVAGGEDAKFRAAIAQGEVSAHVAAAEAGLDYSTGRRQLLRLYEPVTPAPAAPAPTGQPQGQPAQAPPAEGSPSMGPPA